MSWLGYPGARIPITAKVPVIVALLMIAVGVVASERVLSGLASNQERQIKDLTNAYLDGLASALIEPVIRRDSWEIFDVLDQARQLDAAVRPIETVVTDAAGIVLAGSDPRHAAIGSELPNEFPVAEEHTASVHLREDASRAFLDRRLVVEGRSIGTLHAEFDISALLAERRQVFFTLLTTNAALTLVFVVLGWFAVRRMVRPMEVLADHLEQARGGAVQPIPNSLLPRADSEAGRLFRRFNDMAEAVAENETLAARLADEERLASLGRLASGMAHEINNPLGGLLNAVDTLRVHGDKQVVRASALSLIERGLSGIRDVVRASLATYRGDETRRTLTREDFEDVRVLLQPELRRRRQNLDWHLDAGVLPDLPGTPVRQAVLNLLLNASAASPDDGRLSFSARRRDSGGLDIEISDSGPGLPEDAAAILTGGRTYAMLRDGKGLGLWMVRRLVDELGGTIGVGRSALGGAEIRVRLTQARRSEARSDAA